LPTRPTLPVPTPTTPTTPTLTRSAHIGYQGCRAGQVVLSVSVPARPVPLHVPLRYQVRLHNTGRTGCGPPADRFPGASRRLSVGPCGAFSAIVSDHTGDRVYPGPIYYMCPLIAPVHLAPGATATANGTWLQNEFVASGGGGAGQWRPAPPGSYHLSVAPSGSPSQGVSVPFSIVGPAGSHPVPGPTPTIVPG
jgi:hypothetical protein